MRTFAGIVNFAQCDAMGSEFDRSFRFGSASETAALAAALAPVLRPGDAILLQGGLGSGKTHFARTLIQTRLAEAGRFEEVPSPTFTLVQVYSDGTTELWHVDLYRLQGADDVAELGLESAFDNAVCLLEWPDRLGSLAPKDALNLHLEMTETPGERLVRATSSDSKWTDRFLQVAPESPDG